ncbi:ring finger protein 122 [Cricetulus griseus]
MFLVIFQRSVTMGQSSHQQENGRLRKTLFVSFSALFVALQTGLSGALDSSRSCISSPAVAVHNPTRSQHPISVRSGKPTLTSLMHPFQWCNGCFCGLGLVSTNKSCSMPPISFQDLPLNIYMVIFGTGIFVFMLSLIFCCYFISKLRNQAQSERYGYKEVKYHYTSPSPLALIDKESKPKLP